MATGPWDPGSARFLASDADRERTVDILKTAFVHGALTSDELTLRTGRALTARTYADLAATTAGLNPSTPGAPRPRPAPQAARRPNKKRRASKKVVAWSACAVALSTGLGAAFFNYYGGFLVIMLFMFVGAVLLSKPPAPPREPLAKSIGGKY